MNLISIVVVGSIHYDFFIDSEFIPKIGETVLGSSWYPKLGGKGANQSVSLSKLGIKVKLVSAVGKDSFSSYLINQLKKTDIDLNYIKHINTNSGISVAISNSKGDYSAMVVSGANLKISKNILLKNELWKDTKFLMLQNEVEEALNIEAAEQAKKRKIKVFMNAAPAKNISQEMYSLVDILLVNEIEASQITNIGTKDFEKMALLLSKKVNNVIITLGSKGVVICKKNNKPKKISSYKVNVKSAHGAGDFFAGIFLANYIKNSNFEESIITANKKTAEFISK